MKFFFKTLIHFLLLLMLNPLIGSDNYGSRFNFAHKKPAVDQKKFVFVVRSYNNAEYCEKNLTSIFSQNYENFRVIYIEDASTDATYEKVKAIIERFEASDRVTLIHNQINRGSAYNLFTAVHSCQNDEIICIIDGDDWLPHENVLQSLNGYYADPDVWLTYGQTIDYPTGQERRFSKPIPLKVLKEGSIRNKPWMTSHLRTFYAGLYKKVKLQDFLFNGAFVPMAEDVACMLPMIELAREHAYYIDEILYVYNATNPISEHRVSVKLKESIDQYLRGLRGYGPLKEHPGHSPELTQDDTSDLIVFSYDRPLQLYAFLESVEKYAENLGKVFVIYRASTPDFEESYEVVKEAFPNNQYLKQENEIARRVFKPMVLNTAFDSAVSSCKYITFAVDDLVLKDTIDFRKSAFLLEKYQAYAFFFRLGTNIDYCYMLDQVTGLPTPLLKLDDDVYAWNFTKGKGDWAYPNNVDLTLYRKSDLFPLFQSMSFTFPNDFESNWHTKANLNQLGLCYETSKMVNLPLNIVSKYNTKCSNSYTVEKLHELFKSGKKMNIETIHRLKNKAPHVDFDPGFLAR